MLSEKGYENTFLLSGGIEKFLEENTDLVEGTAVPTPRRAIEEEEERKHEARKAERKAKRAALLAPNPHF